MGSRVLFPSKKWKSSMQRMLIYKSFKKYVYEKQFINLSFIDHAFRELKNYISSNISDRIFLKRNHLSSCQSHSDYYLILRDFTVKMS